jgi:hypothetical protein
LENGISAQYSLPILNPISFLFDFVSSRLGSAYKSNAIKQDSYLLSASWHFNKNKPYHFVTRLNAGYFMLIMRKLFKDIPNTAVLFHQK